MNKKTLVIGASPNPERYSYKATKMLADYGHDVFCFGIKKGNIYHIEISNTFPDYESFDTVTLYINPKLQQQYIEFIIKINPKRVIFNPGTENPVFEQMLTQHNIQSVNACTLVMLATHQY